MSFLHFLTALRLSLQRSNQGPPGPPGPPGPSGQPFPADAHPFPLQSDMPAPAAQPQTQEVNTMAFLKITEAQANALRALRPLKTADKAGYKDARSALFANMRSGLGIPDNVVLKVEVDNRDSDQYCVLKGRPPKSKTVEYVPLEAGADGRWVGAASATPSTWAAMPFSDVVALLREQGETMESYRVVGTNVDLKNMATLIPSDSRTELAIDADDNVYFRIDG